MTPARIHHRFDCERPSFVDHLSGSGRPVVQHLGLLVEVAPYAVTAVFAHHRVAVLLGVTLNCVTDISEMDSWTHHLYANPHRLARDTAQAAGGDGGFSDEKHAAGITVISVLDDGDVHIDDIAVLQAFLAGDAVTDLMVHRCANRLREAEVVQWSRDCLLHVDDVVMAQGIEFRGRDPGLYARVRQVEYLCRQTTCDSHLLDVFR